MYKEWQIHCRVVFKGIRYFAVVEQGLRKYVFFTIKHKNKWHLFDAKEILAGKNALFIRPTLKELRKDILDYINKP